jgi:hypothetical protein
VWIGPPDPVTVRKKEFCWVTDGGTGGFRPAYVGMWSASLSASFPPGSGYGGYGSCLISETLVFGNATKVDYAQRPGYRQEWFNGSCQLLSDGLFTSASGYFTPTMIANGAEIRGSITKQGATVKFVPTVLTITNGLGITYSFAETLSVCCGNHAGIPDEAVAPLPPTATWKGRPVTVTKDGQNCYYSEYDRYPDLWAYIRNARITYDSSCDNAEAGAQVAWEIGW